MFTFMLSWHRHHLSFHTPSGGIVQHPSNEMYGLGSRLLRRWLLVMGESFIWWFNDLTPETFSKPGTHRSWRNIGLTRPKHLTLSSVAPEFLLSSSQVVVRWCLSPLQIDLSNFGLGTRKTSSTEPQTSIIWRFIRYHLAITSTAVQWRMFKGLGL